MSEEYTKACFWKCALQVNLADYIQYRGQNHGLTEEEYNQQLLTICLDEGIKVLGIADHGKVTGVDAIRALMTKHDIVVFPGFEIASSEKVHFVCLFPEDLAIQQLERYLGNLKLLDPENGVCPSSLSVEQLIAEVDRLGGFIYAAHCTDDNGLLKKHLNHVWVLPGLRAAQIPGSIEELKGAESDFYRRILLNKESNYKRERPMAIINAKNVDTPETLRLSNASCLIKMTRPSFASFKQAFLDPESRVRLNSEIPENHASAIESARFVGGYLDGVDINFSDYLNAVIGGRGTGKSTLLECIRFALGVKPWGKSAQRQHDEIITENLGLERGQVELVVRSAALNGRVFQITRRFGDQPVVKDKDGKLSFYTAKDILPRLEIFGQNEIYEMTHDHEGQSYLLSRFLEGEQFSDEALIQVILGKLRDNRLSILNAYQQWGNVEAEITQMPKLQDQVALFNSHGLNEKLKMVPSLETEKRLSARVNEELDQLKVALESAVEALPDTGFLNDQAIKDLPHADILSQQCQLLDQEIKNIRGLLTQAAMRVENITTGIQPLYQQLKEKIAAEEDAMEKAFKDIPSSQGKTGREIGIQYQNLLREIERIRPMQKTLEQQQQLLNELESVRRTLLAELIDARAKRSAKLQRALKKLNKKLEKKLRLTIEPEGNRDPLFQFLSESDLEGVGPKKLAWVKENNFFSPANLAATIRQGTEVLKQQRWNMTPSVADTLAKYPRSKLLELEELELPDAIKIELNVGHTHAQENFRQLQRLSIGQQCTAILHLLLLDNQDPLILDQPEDNLDNAFIAERIVTELRSAKISRQFIFATHNANIPVFGDAEWIGVLNVVDGKGEIPHDQQGAIDLPLVKQLAAEILEGGKSAFNKRREKYGFD